MKPCPAPWRRPAIERRALGLAAAGLVVWSVIAAAAGAYWLARWLAG